MCAKLVEGEIPLFFWRNKWRVLLQIIQELKQNYFYKTGLELPLLKLYLGGVESFTFSGLRHSIYWLHFGVFSCVCLVFLTAFGCLLLGRYLQNLYLQNFNITQAPWRDNFVHPIVIIIDNNSWSMHRDYHKFYAVHVYLRSIRISLPTRGSWLGLSPFII